MFLATLVHPSPLGWTRPVRFKEPNGEAIPNNARDLEALISFLVCWQVLEGGWPEFLASRRIEECPDKFAQAIFEKLLHHGVLL